MGKNYEIPLSEKYILNIEEAADYFGIGQKKLRKIVEDNGDGDFVLRNGNRTQIKRKKFEQFIDKVSRI